MTIIIDEWGERDVTEDALAVIRAEAAAQFEQQMAALTWQPIAAYDRKSGAVVVLRDGAGRWTLGYFGAAGPTGDDEEGHRVAAVTWCHAQDREDGRPLGFEPKDFAVADDEWTAALMED